jgi:hypothetical protein
MTTCHLIFPNPTNNFGVQRCIVQIAENIWNQIQYTAAIAEQSVSQA